MRQSLRQNVMEVVLFDHRNLRVALEATGIYSLGLALAFAAGIEVAVLNRKAVNRFAQAIRRSKTDKADAQRWSSLSPLSEEMSVRQWVAHGGLDPAHEACPRWWPHNATGT
ncbi:IS110 family transposase [Edaphobacter modestus]|uniref:IS110 family transposase n=1 Tax=Edaphobacter modestus TaxID=388466 RepID=UPI00102C9018|nr:transposase [Edaphobacter modestus]